MEEIVKILDFVGHEANGKPKAIVCNTVKGKGISFMENVPPGTGWRPMMNNTKSRWKIWKGDLRHERKALREAFGDEMLELGKENPDIYIVDADVGKSCKTLEFAKRFPKQHVNVGIAEQNACGMAAGLATTERFPLLVHTRCLVP